MGDTTMTEPLNTIREEFVNLAQRAHGDDAASIAAEAFRVTLAAHDAEVAANAKAEAVGELARTFTAIRPIHANDPNMQNACSLVEVEAKRYANLAREASTR